MQPKPLFIQIYDNNKYLVIPTETTRITNNQLTVDFTGITISGTWSWIIIYGTGGLGIK